MSAFKASEIKKAIDDLDQPTLDILMKYIYRGFESPKEASQANLLQWHEKVHVCKKGFEVYFLSQLGRGNVGKSRFSLKCVELGNSILWDSISGIHNSFDAMSFQMSSYYYGHI